MSTWVFSAVNAYVNRMVRKRLHSKFVTARPLIYFLAGQSQMGLDALMVAQKNPNDNFRKGVSIGGGGYLSKAQRLKTLGSQGHEFRYQESEPDSGSLVSPGGATPQASVFSEDLVGTAETRWTLENWPLKIRESTIENTRGTANIAPVVDEAMAMSFNVAFDGVQTRFWSDTLTSAQQNRTEWDNGLIGITHAVSDGTTSGETTYTHIGRVDRTVKTVLKSTVNEAATLVTNGHMPTTKPTLELIRRLRTINSIGGLANIDPDAGDLAITTPDLFNVLANEAEGDHTIHDNANEAVPGMATTIGFKYPVICKDRTYITYDPDCPSGEMYLLSLNSFVYEVAPGCNYRVNDWVPKWQTEEGGERYRWAQIELKHRLTLAKPWLCSKTVDLTTT